MTVGPCETEAIRRGEPERIRQDARRIDALTGRLNATIAALGVMVAEVESSLRPAEPRAVLRLVAPD